MPTPSEPLTVTTSPGPTAAVTRGASSPAVAACAPRRRSGSDSCRPRTDNGSGSSAADVGYGYGQALADGVVRPVVFAAYTGTSRWRNSAGEVIAASLSGAGTKRTETTAWRTALNPKGRWVPHVIAAMDERITHLRAAGVPEAAADGALRLCLRQAVSCAGWPAVPGGGGRWQSWPGGAG